MNSITRLGENPRITVRKAGPPDPDGHCVVYWMQRAQRAFDNSALDVAVEVGNELGKPVVVFFAPVPFYPRANLRAFQFLMDGIPDIAEALARRGIGFVLRCYPHHSLLRFCEEVRASIVIGDENPLREPEDWRLRVARRIRVPFWTVDADVIVPSKLLQKEHYAARTIRPRIHELLPEFLVEPQNPEAHCSWASPPRLHSLAWDHDVTREWTIDRSVKGVAGTRGGSKQALRALDVFVRTKLSGYPERRNHPELDGTSRLSPYLHFGHLGPYTVALAVNKAEGPQEAKKAFLEQLIVRRELSVNFVRFNPAYDSVDCVEPWADRSFAEHTGDRRPVIYSDEQLDQAETHDPLWNAAQKQMVITGWMHNYLRMYWAKKILEWSPGVASALQRAIWLNDRYELDGRDPNSYEGIAWAILGKHDRAWPERPVFGKIRYMSLASTSRKFDSERFIAQVANLEGAHG
ncbi:MAG: deoxyribodipyrimidine photo-lyase [Acidobacteriaceae bacterium]|nr:deoxyribodipyrimidine photo-lyase [Acidobacteriaceae bacterium]